MNHADIPYKRGYEHYYRQMTKRFPDDPHTTWEELSEDERACWRAGFEEFADQVLEQGRREGAAIAFGITAMAEEIRRSGPPLVKRDYWTTDDGECLYTCFCPGCGAYMKHCHAGVDEGTDNEWCGACRY